MSDTATERALRARVTELQAELRSLSFQIAALFRTSGWVHTEDEPPPIDLRVLGSSRETSLIGWYTRTDYGKWRHDYMNGHVYEESSGPEFWMVLPAVPE